MQSRTCSQTFSGPDSMSLSHPNPVGAGNCYESRQVEPRRTQILGDAVSVSRVHQNISDAKENLPLHTLPMEYMGTKRKEAQGRRLIRLTKAVENRDTLLNCEACEGVGSRIIESDDDGRYRKIPCNWCDKGLTDKDTAALFTRWQSILIANRHNPCKA